jgi:4-coumarate--CoA ligase
MSLLIKRFGSSLVRMGCRRGDVLGIILPNVIEYPIAMYGAAGVGMPVALINPMYTVGK